MYAGESVRDKRTYRDALTAAAAAVNTIGAQATTTMSIGRQ